MNINGLMLGVLLVAALIIGAGNWMVGMTSNYNTFINYNDSYFAETYSVLNETYTITEDMSTSMEEKETNVISGFLETGVIFRDTVAMIFEVPNLFKAILYDSLTMVNIAIPGWFRNLIIFSFSITVVLLGLSALLRWRMA